MACPLASRTSVRLLLPLFIERAKVTAETVNVKGFDTAIGYTEWTNKPAETDAAVRSSPPPPPHPI